jgi:hypothetical protein
MARAERELFAAMAEVNTIAGAGVGWFSVATILNQTGYSGFWSLAGFIPVIDIVMLWQFSKALNGRLYGRMEFKTGGHERALNGVKFRDNPLRAKRIFND